MTSISVAAICFVNGDHPPHVAQEFEVLVCWMDSKPLGAGNKYLLQLGSRTVRGLVKDIEYRLDVNTLEKAACTRTGRSERYRKGYPSHRSPPALRCLYRSAGQRRRYSDRRNKPRHRRRMHVTNNMSASNNHIAPPAHTLPKGK